MPDAPTQLPKDVSKFLNSSDLLFRIIEILEKHKLPEEKYDELAPIFEGVVNSPRALASLPSKVQKVTGLDQTQATRLTADLVGYWLLPLEAYVGDVAGYIISWGGKLEDYPKKRIAKRAVNPDKFTKETIEALGQRLDEPNLQKRLEYILASFVRGVRAADDTVAVLSRSKKVGGVELPEQRAKRLVEHFQEKMRHVEIDRGAEVKASASQKKKEIKKEIKESVASPKPLISPLPVKPAKSKQPPKAPKPPIKLPTPSKRQSTVKFAQAQVPKSAFEAATITKADEKEIAVQAKKIEKIRAPAVSIEEMIEKVVVEAGLSFEDEGMRKRFKNIVGSRLRDVRDAIETRSMIEEDVAKGGMGLKGKDLARVVELIERTFDEVRGKEKKEKDKEKKEYLEKRKTASAKREDLAKAESEILAKRYASMTGKAPDDLAPPAAPTAARVSATKVGEADLKAAASRIDQKKVNQVFSRVKRQPPPAKAKLSPKTISEQTAKPTVRDIAYAKRLVGPVDELAHLDITSFRRLSADPKEAVLKVKDKIDLLESQSYAKKLEGIRAWQLSPVNQMYVELVREALMTGRPIKKLIEGRKGAREEVLTEEEIKEIMKLNKQLKF